MLAAIRAFIAWRRRSTRWLLRQEGDEVHVLPERDLMMHLVEDCACGTLTEPCPRDDGSMGWLVTHYSHAGRERSEAS